MKKKTILTGDRPTGKLHLGHWVGSVQNRVTLQHDYDQYLIIANVQALTDNFDHPEKVKESIMELILDYYAVGIDFSVSTVFIQSEVPQIHEIFIYLANFATLQQLSHNPTLKTEIGQKKFEASTPLGFYIYPLHQAADILCVDADLVPVGKDQAPMVEDTRELARRFNNAYQKDVLSQPDALFGTTQNLPGIDGNAKMSKSLQNAIFLADSDEKLKMKVFQIKTDPNRIRATDPGTVEGNTIFIYHDTFNPDPDEVAELKQRYQKGTVGDVEVKQRLLEVLQAQLAPIRDRRADAASKKDELLEIVLENNRKVAKKAQTVVDRMKDAMQISF